MVARSAFRAGVVLVIFGAAAIVVAPHVGVYELPRPWSFLAGFFMGIATGMGVALTAYGLATGMHRK